MATNKSSTEDRLSQASQALVNAVVGRATKGAERKVGQLTDKMESMAHNGGLSLPGGGAGKALGAVPGALSGAVSGVVGTAKDKLSDALPVPGLGGNDDDDGGGSSGDGNGSSTKVTTIIEEIDVGVPVSLVYDQWTEFGSFPSFMKKVENVDAVEDQRLKWKAQIFWSHREWEATILDQVPEERIVWRSEGKKGHVDGAVTFHELTPDLTRVIVVLEYYPQGLFERTANLWRAQGRRVRAELQHFRRHVMAHAVLDPDQVDGWHGVIEDAEVVESDEDHRESEEDEQDDDQELDEPEDEYDEEDDEDSDEPEDEYEDDDEYDDEDSDEPEDEYEDDDEYDDEDSDEPADEYDDEDEDYEDDDESDEPEDEYDDEDESDEPEDEYDDDEDEDEDEEYEDDEDDEYEETRA